MSKERIISFYPDFSKNHEFIKRITEILNRPDSSIGLCYISKSISDRFCVFIEPLELKEDSNQISFGFDRTDRLLNIDSRKKYINDYIDEGYSELDLESLTDLFADFSFNNYYEGLFFGSKFFDIKFRPLQKSYILKYTPNEKSNRYLIEGKKLSRHYSKTTLSNLREAIIERDTISIEPESLLTPCNVYLLREARTIEDAIKLVKQSLDPEAVVVEYYRDQETAKGYVKSAYHVDGENLVLVNLKKL